jgi:ketosteroid isomerase-like protein
MSEKTSLFAEMRRRNVFRVALTYAVVAWLLIEIAAVFVPMLEAPEWIITAFLVVLALGFVLAMFISWSFEMTPEGLKRTEDLAPDEVIPYWSRRKFARFIIGVAIIAFGLSAYQLLRPRPNVIYPQIGPVSISQSSTADSLTDDRNTARPAERILRDLDAQWSKAAAARDLERTVAFYSDDAIVLPPNATAAATKETVRNVWKEFLGAPGLMISWEPSKVKLGHNGAMAWVSGRYELTMNDATGKPMNDRGKYLEVWEKQADGNWKCAADMWNSDLTTPATASAEKE